MSRQLPLPVGLRDGCTLDSYLDACNGQALAAVRALLAGDEPVVYLWGPPGTGRSHLLEAAADAVARRGEPVLWVPLAGGGRPGPAILEGAGDSATLVCLDDIDTIAGDRAWEEAVFHLFNDLRARRARLLASALAPPAASGLRLPDLVSRLGSGLVVALQPLGDEERLAVLTFRAARRGLELSPEAGRYLLARASRRLEDLVGLLAELDRAALVHQRRLTLPFVRQVLSGQA